MKEIEDGFNDSRGTAFFVRGWEVDHPKAVVALVHGQGEHTGRYAHVGNAFCEAGYSLVGFDLRGHGRSGGQRGHSPSYETLLEDLAGFFQLLARRYPDPPRFLYGHSMGGSIVLNYAIRRNPELLGVIATGPWLRLAFEPPAGKVALARIIGHIVPTFSQPSGLENDALSRDSKIVSAYSTDPLVHNSISARHFLGIRESGLWALDHAGELRLPVLLMHGGADRITSEAASREFARLAGDRVTFRSWDGLYHELHNEPEKGEVIRTMVEWMDAHLPRSQGQGG